MRRLLRIVTDFLGTWVSPEVAFGLVVLGLVLLAPVFYDQSMQRRTRNLVRQLVRAPAAERPSRVEEIFTHCGKNPKRLRIAVEAGRKYAQVDVAERAATLLGEVVPGGMDAFKKADRSKRKSVTPLDFLLRAEQQEQSGLRAIAARTVKQGLRQHPEDPELLAMAARLREVAAAAEEPGEEPGA